MARDKLWVLRDGSKLNPPGPHYWELLDIQVGIEEAPFDNVKYVRRNGAWVPVGIQQIVWKGTDDPNTLPSFGTEGDKYLRTPSQTTGIDYVIQLVNSEIIGKVYNTSTGEGSVISGTPDINYFYIYSDLGSKSLDIAFIDSNSVNPNGSITINSFTFNLADATVNGSTYSFGGNTALAGTIDSLYQNILSNGDVINVTSGATSAQQNYREYIKQADGTWQSINIEYITEKPLDQVLRNADITSSNYDITLNQLTQYYGAFGDIPAGYYSVTTDNFSQNGTPNITKYYDPTGVLQLTVTWTPSQIPGLYETYIRS